MNNISFYKEIIQRNKGKLESLQERRELLQNNLDIFIYNQKLLEESQIFIQQVAKETQEQLKFNIVDTVNLCIATCFQNIIFDIDFKIMNNRTTAKLIYKKDGYEIDPLENSGGGLVELTSFALRIALWNISHTDNVLILDEPLQKLQPKELQIQAFQTIKMLSEKLNLQFIIVANSIGSENILDVSDKIFKIKLTKQKINNKVWNEVSKVE